MDIFMYLFRSVLNLFLTICNIEFSIFGYTVTYGQVFIFAFIFGFICWFLHHLIS